MWRSVGAVAGDGASPPPPVHRGARLAGTCEAGLWAPISKGEVERIEVMAERLDRGTKQPGRHGGVLGRAALAVLRALAELVDHGTGQLCPSWAWLEARTGYCRDSVWRALVRLREAGIVVWLPRYQETGLGRERGPQVMQTSNAYALRLPPELAALIATLPDAHALAREAAQRREAARAKRLASWREARDRRAAEVAARMAALCLGKPEPPPLLRGLEAERARFKRLLDAIRFDKPRGGAPPD